MSFSTGTLPIGGITSVYEKKCSRAGQKADFFELLQPAIFGSQIQQPVETYTRLEQSESIPQSRKIQNGDTRTMRTSLQQGEWVTSIDFKDACFYIPTQEQSRKY